MRRNEIKSNHHKIVSKKVQPDRMKSAEDSLWDWAVEEQPRVGRVRIWLWRHDLSTTEALDPIRVESRKGTVDVVVVKIGNQSADVYIGAEVDTDSHTVEIKAVNRIEIGLKTREAIVCMTSRNSVPEVEGAARFALTKLKREGLGRICCGKCTNELVNGFDRVNMKWFALPSADWEEFVEYWVCHEDMKLKSSYRSTNGGAGGGLRKPAENEGFLGDGFVEFDLDWIHQISCCDNQASPAGWKRRSQSLQSRESKSKDDQRKNLIECNRCNFTIGEAHAMDDESAAPVREQVAETRSTSLPVPGGSAHHDSKKRLITFYKRAIIFRPQHNGQLDSDRNYPTQSHFPDLGGDEDEVMGRAFETTLVYDELAKMIESNGFYKFLIKNPTDSHAIGLWIFCPLIFIHHNRQLNPKQRLKRSKIMWVMLDGHDSLDYHNKMTIFENGANPKTMPPLGSSSSSMNPNPNPPPPHHHPHNRRIGEMNLPTDHFDLLVERLETNSIYSIGRRDHRRSRSQDVEVSLLSKDSHLSTSSPAYPDPDDDLFQGIYRVSYL